LWDSRKKKVDELKRRYCIDDIILGRKKPRVQDWENEDENNNSKGLSVDNNVSNNGEENMDIDEQQQTRKKLDVIIEGIVEGENEESSVTQSKGSENNNDATARKVATEKNEKRKYLSTTASSSSSSSSSLSRIKNNVNSFDSSDLLQFLPRNLPYSKKMSESLMKLYDTCLFQEDVILDEQEHVDRVLKQVGAINDEMETNHDGSDNNTTTVSTVARNSQ